MPFLTFSNEAEEKEAGFRLATSPIRPKGFRRYHNVIKTEYERKGHENSEFRIFILTEI